MPEKPSVALIYNPAAGSGRFRPSAARVRAALEEAGGDVQLFATRGPGDGVSQGRLAAERHSVVAVYGGDGSVNEALNGMIESRRPATVLILAGGTMNVLARDLNIPRNPLRAARLLSAGVPRTIYLGRAEGPTGARYFMLMASAGFDASIVYHTAARSSLKKAIGPFAYVVEGLRHLIAFESAEIIVETEEREYRGYSVLVGKSRGYGGWFSVTAQADVTKPDFQVAVCRQRRLFRYFPYLALALASRLDLSPSYTFFRATRVRLRSQTDVRMQMDGEPAGRLPAEFSIDGASVRVLTPP